jgi:hypothetical protein
MNTKITLILLIAILASLGFAQEPFKQFRTPIKSPCSQPSDSTIDEVYLWEPDAEDHSELILPCVFSNGDTCRLLLSVGVENKTTKIEIFRNSKLIQEFHHDSIAFVSSNFTSRTAIVADFNNDHLSDIKIYGAYLGADTYGGGLRIIYLLQDTTGHFTELSFFDKIGLDERDLDGDSIFVCVTTTFNHLANGHSYWTYNLYKFKHDNLIDVSRKHNYPIFVQELFKENHKVARDIPDAFKRSYIQLKPPEFLRDKGIIYK